MGGVRSSARLLSPAWRMPRAWTRPGDGAGFCRAAFGLRVPLRRRLSLSGKERVSCSRGGRSVCFPPAGFWAPGARFSRCVCRLWPFPLGPETAVFPLTRRSLRRTRAIPQTSERSPSAPRAPGGWGSSPVGGSSVRARGRSSAPSPLRSHAAAFTGQRGWRVAQGRVRWRERPELEEARRGRAGSSPGAGGPRGARGSRAPAPGLARLAGPDRLCPRDAPRSSAVPGLACTLSCLFPSRDVTVVSVLRPLTSRPPP